MKRMPVGTYASLTDIGRVRLANEDQALAAVNSHGEVLLAVLDGMGGNNKGDLASSLAKDLILDAFYRKKATPLAIMARFWLGHALASANKKVYTKSESSPLYKGMGTTFSGVLLIGKKAVVANVGDSRCYLYGEGGLKRLTEDQTYVSFLLRTGKLKPEQAAVHPDRHVLLNALGIYPSLSLSYKTICYEGESILCCTDGLYNSLKESDIEAVLRLDSRADQKAGMLCRMASEFGGSDNVGVSYWEAIRD